MSAEGLLNDPALFEDAVGALHERRIDIVFAHPAPTTVKSNVLDTEISDKTLSGLWPSDHASVSAELSY